ncbi:MULTISPECIES: DsbA family protein [Phenylobacterium]|uniref:Protein-disulfide isomerase n=1 Tax=Phenylobacterium koreense TaxID=266125 RepID=A0ABV2EGB2_9CAUL
MTPRFLSLLIGAVLLAGCDQVADTTFEHRLRAYLLDHPEVIREAAIKLKEKKAREVPETIARHQEQLEHDPRDFVANPGGNITVVQFFDYRCPYSRAAAPQILKLIRERPDIRVVFKPYPLLGSTSDWAARMSLTPQAKAKGLQVYQALMSSRDLNQDRIDQALRSVGVDPVAARRAASDPTVDQQIRDARALAAGINITGTPTFVVGDQMIAGADMERLSSAMTRTLSSHYSSVGAPLTSPAPFGTH